MSFQYIKNKWLWEKKQEIINKLLKRPYESLSTQEKLEVAYDKYHKHEKISYDEYEMIATVANDEICFCYKNVEYQIIHELNESTVMYIVEYDGIQKLYKRSESFCSTNNLLEKFRIDGKTIKEIWKDLEN